MDIVHDTALRIARKNQEAAQARCEDVDSMLTAPSYRKQVRLPVRCTVYYGELELPSLGSVQVEFMTQHPLTGHDVNMCTPQARI